MAAYLLAFQIPDTQYNQNREKCQETIMKISIKYYVFHRYMIWYNISQTVADLFC